jgi:hypothetical protein
MNSTPSPRGKKIAAFIIGAALAAFTALGAAGCAPAPEAAPADNDPVTISEVPGTDLHRLALTEHAVDRVGIQTGTAAADPATGKLTVPYAAIIYDSAGKTWVYTTPEPRVYVRQPITVERINGGVAVLSDGPAAGTAVVTTGAEELFGAEFDTAH